MKYGIQLGNFDRTAGIFICVFLFVFFYFCPTIPQDLLYHNFADQRSLLSINNALNVLSNLMFIVSGIYALLCFNLKTYMMPLALQRSAKIFFTASIFIGLGSAYYHLDPNNTTLVWDRLPMSIAFMALFNLIIAAFIDEKLAEKTLIVMLATGIASVLYWAFTETTGQGDLRLYILVQFVPFLVTPIILFKYHSIYLQKKPIIGLLVTYLLAKLFEQGDMLFFHMTGLVSGHSIKHLLAGLSPLFILMAFLPPEKTSQ